MSTRMLDRLLPDWDDVPFDPDEIWEEEDQCFSDGADLLDWREEPGSEFLLYQAFLDGQDNPALCRMALCAWRDGRGCRPCGIDFRGPA